MNRYRLPASVADIAAYVARNSSFDFVNYTFAAVAVAIFEIERIEKG